MKLINFHCGQGENLFLIVLGHIFPASFYILNVSDEL